MHLFYMTCSRSKNVNDWSERQKPLPTRSGTKQTQTQKHTATQTPWRSLTHTWPRPSGNESSTSCSPPSPFHRIKIDGKLVGSYSAGLCVCVCFVLWYSAPCRTAPLAERFCSLFFFFLFPCTHKHNAHSHCLPFLCVFFFCFLVDSTAGFEGTWKAVGVNEHLLFARYTDGGHFSPHTDGYTIVDFNKRSLYTLLLYLNDCQEGGMFSQLPSVVQKQSGKRGRVKEG